MINDEIIEIAEMVRRTSHRVKNAGRLNLYRQGLRIAKQIKCAIDLIEALKLESRYNILLRNVFMAYGGGGGGGCSEYGPVYDPPQQAKDAAKILDDKPYAVRQCAKYVIDSINEAGKGSGIVVDVISDHAPENIPEKERMWAKYMGGTLENSHFQVAYTGKQYPPPASDRYEPKIGDIAVVQGIQGDPVGHACMWVGKNQWVSDYDQHNTVYPYPETNNAARTVYKIYRWPQ